MYGMETFDEADRRVGLVDLDDLASLLEDAGFTVISGPTISEAAKAIIDEWSNGSFPILVADSESPALHRWVTNVASHKSQPSVSVLTETETPEHINHDAIGVVPMPVKLAELSEEAHLGEIDEAHAELTYPESEDAPEHDDVIAETLPSFTDDEDDSDDEDWDSTAAAEAQQDDPEPSASVDDDGDEWDSTPTRTESRSSRRPARRAAAPEPEPEPEAEARPEPEQRSEPDDEDPYEKGLFNVVPESESDDEPLHLSASSLTAREETDDDDLGELFATSGSSKARRCPVISTVSGTGGVGKACVLVTPVPTPTGTITMGDVEVGTVVLGRDGRPTTVTATFDHEDLELYDVTFSDGQVIRACADHRWLVSGYYDRINRQKPKRHAAIERYDHKQDFANMLDELANEYAGEPITLKEIMALIDDHPGCDWEAERSFSTQLNGSQVERRRGNTGAKYDGPEAFGRLAARVRAQMPDKRPTLDATERVLTTAEMIEWGVKVHPGGKATTNFAVRTTEALDLPGADLPLDPYVLGAWLADGGTGSSSFASPDAEILDRIESVGYSIRRGSMDKQTDPKTWCVHRIQDLIPMLRKAGVFGAKHIPTTYLRASKTQRLELLQGLLDCDGSIRKDGVAELSLSDERLATDALELIRSMGIKAQIRTGEAGYRNEAGEYVQCKDRHRIAFTTDQPVFWLPRKAQRLATELRYTQDWIYITDISPAGRGSARCLTVDNEDHVFLVHGFIPTHNSTASIQLATAAAAAGYRTVLVDGDRGQGDLETYLRLNTSGLEVPTIADTVGGHAKAREVVLTADKITKLRAENAEPVPDKFALVRAPDHRDTTEVTPQRYLALINKLREQVDIVIVDSPILKSDDHTGVARRLIIPLLEDGGFSLSISDNSDPGMKNLSQRLNTFAEHGISRRKMLITINAADPSALRDLDAAARARLHGRQGIYVGTIGFDRRINKKMRSGSFDLKNRQLDQVIYETLYRVTGDTAFDLDFGIEHHNEDEATGGGFFSRLMWWRR